MIDSTRAPAGLTQQLAIYDRACAALAEAVAVDEVLQIRDQARALEACARVAKNKTLEADAVVLRMRATRRLDQMRQAQKETVGLNRGLAGSEITGLSKNPVKDSRPTLASQGIDKNLAHHARVLGALTDEKFEEAVADTHAAVTRAVRRVVQVLELDEERERAKACITTGGAAGCTIDDLVALAAGGYRAGAILGDPPWPFATWTHLGFAGDKTQKNRAQRSRAAPYQTMSHEDIYELPVGSLAADDCVLFLWVVQTQLDKAFETVKRWGFDLKSVGFSWFKGEEPDDDVDELHVPIGTGFWTRAGFEQCWLATRGKPRRLHADVRQVIVEPRREHSRKPDCVHERIERLVAGPCLELFARPASPGLTRPSWTCWGDEIPRGQMTHGDEVPAALAPAVVP